MRELPAMRIRIMLMSAICLQGLMSYVHCLSVLGRFGMCTCQETTTQSKSSQNIGRNGFVWDKGRLSIPEAMCIPFAMYSPNHLTLRAWGKSRS